MNQRVAVSDMDCKMRMQGDESSPSVILSVAKDQLGKRESSTYRMIVVRGALVLQLQESRAGH
jgi:hypothetical protein